MLARRSVQKMLNESVAYLSTEQVKRLVAHLNRNNRDAIGAEWELIMLAALASMGVVEHEPNLGGTSRLDVRFRSPTLKFVADVRAVSDETYNRENPVQELSTALGEQAAILRKEGIAGGFDFRVNAAQADPRRGKYKTKLILPFVHEFQEIIFDAAFDDYLANIRREPSKVHHHAVDKDAASVSIVFNPGGLGGRFFSHPAYNLAHDLIHNVVYQALERKSRQIKRAGPRASGELAGVILCDAGCAMFHSVHGVGTVALNQVIRTFLQKSRTVDFVCVVEVIHSIDYGSTAPPRFSARVWSTRHPVLRDEIERQVNQSFRALPTPLQSAINTLNQFEWAGKTQRLWGRYKRNVTMRDQSVEISLRGVMDYLAGRIEREEFEKIVPTDWLAHLRRNLDRGSGIREVSIKRCPGEDDDGLVITFGGHDPAISLFRAPEDH